MTWSFSIWLEAFAIIPQLDILRRNKEEVERFNLHYIAVLGLYRVFYLFNWINRYVTEFYISWVAVSAGIVQIILYFEFFYLYIRV